MSHLVPRSAATGPAPAISVVVPVLDGGARLLELVRAVCVQTVGAGPVELLLADSGSRDGAVAACLLAAPDARCFDVHGGFDHGLVRQRLVEEARAPLVAILSQDAVPIGPRYLEALAAPFAAEDVAGATARQVGRPEATPDVIATLAAWTPALTDAFVIRRPPPGLADLSPSEQMRLARHDNVASMVRRCHALAHPFEATEFGEDLSWGWRVLRADLALAYVPSAAVEHSHAPGLAGTFERHRRSHRHARREFGLRAVPSLGAAAVAWISALPGDLRGGPRSGLTRGLRRGAELLGQWRGGVEGGS